MCVGVGRGRINHTHRLCPGWRIVIRNLTWTLDVRSRPLVTDGLLWSLLRAGWLQFWKRGWNRFVGSRWENGGIWTPISFVNAASISAAASLEFLPADRAGRRLARRPITWPPNMADGRRLEVRASHCVCVCARRTFANGRRHSSFSLSPCVRPAFITSNRSVCMFILFFFFFQRFLPFCPAHFAPVGRFDHFVTRTPSVSAPAISSLLTFTVHISSYTRATRPSSSVLFRVFLDGVHIRNDKQW